MSGLVLAIALSIAAAVPTFAMTSTGYFQGEELMMLSNSSESQMMGFVLTTANGAVIVIDGGTPADAPHLREEIAKRGNHVSAWFITHPHSDHGGAFAQIVEEGLNGMTVDAVIYNFTDPAWYQANEEYRADTVERIRAAVLSFGDKAHVMHRNDIFVFDTAVITCMNDPYLVSGNSINNSSCALRVQMGGQTIMFLGDMGEDVGNMFLADHAGENLKCDMVQMAHHGQAGVGYEFYRALAPTSCLWCAPAWLYEDYYGKYRTKETRGWMESLGVRKHFVIKDGDQIIR